MDQVAIIHRPWRDPLDAARPFAEESYAALLRNPDGWSYLVREPDRVLTVDAADPTDAFAALAAGLEPFGPERARRDGPPFQGGWAGLASYEFGARAEPVALPRHPDWPDLVCGLYRALLAFDAEGRRVMAVGRGADMVQAKARAAAAAAWLDAQVAPRQAADAMAETFEGSSGEAYEHAVAEVVARIAAGEIFQANIARRWSGRLKPGQTPYALFERLDRDSPAASGGYFRLPGLAVASNSPEQFIRIDPAAGPLASARPIKGTRPRGADARADAALGRALVADPKDRAENLMIVDLMRNDLARVSHPGTVKVPALFELNSYANVHHLVSTVTARLRPGVGPAEMLKAAFPAGSITGAPKVQAMKVIAVLEPPRGPYCGTLFWAGFDGGMDSSVLIRTVACVRDAQGWRVEAGAGGGIVADSRPQMERLETEAKIDAIRRALIGASGAKARA